MEVHFGLRLLERAAGHTLLVIGCPSVDQSQIAAPVGLVKYFEETLQRCIHKVDGACLCDLQLCIGRNSW